LGIQETILDFLTTTCSLFFSKISSFVCFFQELIKLFQFLEDKQKMPLEKKLNDSYILGNEKKNFLYLLKKDKVSLSDTSSNIFSSSSSYGQSNTNISSNSINPKQNKKSIKEEFLK